MCVCTYAAKGIEEEGFLALLPPILGLPHFLAPAVFLVWRKNRDRARFSVLESSEKDFAMRTEYLMDMKLRTGKKGSRRRWKKKFSGIDLDLASYRELLQPFCYLFRLVRNVSYVGFVEFSISQLSPPWNSRFLLFRAVEFPRKEQGRKEEDEKSFRERSENFL